MIGFFEFPSTLGECYKICFMRKIPLLLLFLFGFLSSHAQSYSKPIALEDYQPASTTSTTSVITGRISNLTPDEAQRIVVEYSVVTPFLQTQQKGTSKVEADGSFMIALSQAMPLRQLWIRIDTLMYAGVYLTNQLTIHLDAAIAKKKTIYFSGPGLQFSGPEAALNAYAGQKINFQREQQLELDKQIQMLIFSRKGYDQELLKTYDSLSALVRQIDQAYFKQYPSTYQWLIENETTSKYLSNLSLLHLSGRMDNQLFSKVINHKPVAVSNDGVAFYRYLFMYCNAMATQKMNERSIRFESPSATDVQVALLDSLFPPSKADFLKMQIGSKDPETYRRILAQVIPTMKGTWCKSLLASEYTNTVAKVEKVNEVLNNASPIKNVLPLGQPVARLSNGAALYQRENGTAEELLVALKQAFPGKAIYIDCWATWCAPCIGEFPASNKLSDNCQDLPVEFVYLCTSNNSTPEKWKSKIVEHNLKGTHIYVNQVIGTAFMGLFSKSGYPSYILINAKGDFVSSFDKRPSELNKARMELAIR